jgi:hypothetical protein
MRLAIAEARRLPERASSVGQMAREQAAEGVARLLREAVRSDDLGTLPLFGPEHLATTAGFFLDLILLALMVRALLGEKLRRLHAEILPHAEGSVAFFVAACRNDASNSDGHGKLVTRIKARSSLGLLTHSANLERKARSALIHLNSACVVCTI